MRASYAFVMTREQEAFLRFHAEGAFPHRWAWLDKDSRDVTGPPETWVKLRAWKHGTTEEWQRRCTIGREDLRGLQRYFDDGFRVNASGRIALKHKVGRPERLAKDIVRDVAMRRGVTVEQLRSEDRTRRMAHIRQEAIALCMAAGHSSLRAATAAGRHHTTALYAREAHWRREAAK